MLTSYFHEFLIPNFHIFLAKQYITKTKLPDWLGFGKNWNSGLGIRGASHVLSSSMYIALHSNTYLYVHPNNVLIYVCQWLSMVLMTYTQYPIIRNSDQRWPVEFLKNYRFLDSDRFYFSQAHKWNSGQLNTFFIPFGCVQQKTHPKVMTNMLNCPEFHS